MIINGKFSEKDMVRKIGFLYAHDNAFGIIDQIVKHPITGYEIYLVVWHNGLDDITLSSFERGTDIVAYFT